MRPRRAIVLAVGQGPPDDQTGSRPPASLATVAGRTLIDRQLDALAACGIRRVCLVTGACDDRLRARAASRATVLADPSCQAIGSLRALWLACGQLEGGAVVIDGDVLFAPSLLERLLASDYPDALLLDSRRPLTPSSTPVHLAGPFVVDLGRHVPAGRADGQVVGLLKLGAEGGRRLAAVLARLVVGGASDASATDAVAELARTWPVLGLDTLGLPWAGLNRDDDLGAASWAVPGEGGDGRAEGGTQPRGGSCT